VKSPKKVRKIAIVASLPGRRDGPLGFAFLLTKKNKKQKQKNFAFLNNKKKLKIRESLLFLTKKTNKKEENLCFS